MAIKAPDSVQGSTTSQAGPFPTARGPGCHDGAVLLADVVAASAAVGATRSRTAKAAAIAALLRRADVAEVEPVTGWLAGEAR
jgi:hypothetical protein